MPLLPLRTVVCALLFSTVSLNVQASDISLFFQDSDLDFSGYTLPGPGQADMWERIRQGFGIPDLDNAQVATQIDWHSARPEHLEKTGNRASRYLYYVVEELEKRNMPTELALLPFIESAFDPQAYSKAHAAGMWQFIPSTGLHFKLKQNSFRDERRSVLASTEAALNYLDYLHGMFEDWQLALAAYNWGEGSVRRAIKKAEAAGLATDFNGLTAFMPAETRNYVPKLQALKNIVAKPKNYGMELPPVENTPYFVAINKTRDIDVEIAAELAELSMEEFRALNPQFKRPVIAGSPKTQILLPKENAKRFAINLAKWDGALSNWAAHTITNARERIETLATRFKTTPEVIRQANNIPPNMRLKAGSTILVPRISDAPGKDITLALADSALLSMEPDRPESKTMLVKVARQDTLSTIARRYQISVVQIKRWNNLKKDLIVAGQILKLQTTSAPSIQSTLVAEVKTSR